MKHLETFINIPISMKKRVFEQFVLPVMTNGAKSITLTNSTLKLRSTQKKRESAMLGVTLKDKIKNENLHTS